LTEADYTWLLITADYKFSIEEIKFIYVDGRIRAGHAVTLLSRAAGPSF